MSSELFIRNTVKEAISVGLDQTVESILDHIGILIAHEREHNKLVAGRTRGLPMMGEITAMVLAEREACAKIADDHRDDTSDIAEATAEAIAEAIRARGTKVVEASQATCNDFNRED